MDTYTVGYNLGRIIADNFPLLLLALAILAAIPMAWRHSRQLGK